MKQRRQVQSSALSFIDCICCGFGAVLLLFILTAKSQIIQKEAEAKQALTAVELLRDAMTRAKQEQQSVDQALKALDPQSDAETVQLDSLTAEQANLSAAIEERKTALSLLDEATKPTDAIAAQERPSAPQKYLSGLTLRGPRMIILLENSGSMLAEDTAGAMKIIGSGNENQAEKWLRAKAAVRTVLASIPKGTKVAILQMNQTTAPLSGNPKDPYIDPYDNAALISFLERLDSLKPSGGANFLYALTAIRNLKEPPNSLLLIGDGLPTAPNPNNRPLSEADRVKLFNRAMSMRPKSPFNAILFPFKGDPSAAGLFWKLSSRTNGIVLTPNKDWPPQ